MLTNISKQIDGAENKTWGWSQGCWWVGVARRGPGSGWLCPVSVSHCGSLCEPPPTCTGVKTSDPVGRGGLASRSASTAPSRFLSRLIGVRSKEKIGTKSYAVHSFENHKSFS